MLKGIIHYTNFYSTEKVRIDSAVIMDIRAFFGKQRVPAPQSICPVCKAVFANKYSLARHQRNRGYCASRLNQCCDFCDKDLCDMKPQSAANHRLRCKRRYEENTLVVHETLPDNSVHANMELKKQNQLLKKQNKQLQQLISKEKEMKLSTTTNNTYINQQNNITIDNSIHMNVYHTKNEHGLYIPFNHDTKDLLRLLHDRAGKLSGFNTMTEGLLRVLSNHFNLPENNYVQRIENQYHVKRSHDTGYVPIDSSELKTDLGQQAFSTMDEVVTQHMMDQTQFPKTVVESAGFREAEEAKSFYLTQEYENKFDTLFQQSNEIVQTGTTSNLSTS